MWSRKTDGILSREGLYRARYFNLLSRLWEAEPQPIKACLREIREADTDSIRWVRGTWGALKAVRVEQ